MDNNSSLINQQREYIQNHTSPINIFLRFKVSRLKKSRSDISEYERNKEIIKQINTDKCRNALLSAKFQINRVRLGYSNIIHLSNTSINTSDGYCAIACIVKNESLYIEEWIKFHLEVGFDFILLFDNGSTDNLKESIQKYIQSGKVIYIFYPGKKAQVYAYYDACRIVKKSIRWLALIDADEFLFSPKEKNIKNVLKKYEKHVAIGVNWVVFGPNGHEKRPDGNVIDNYVATFENENNELNCRIKSIVQPSKVIAIPSPHYCIYRGGELAVDEDCEEIVGEALFVKTSGSCTLVNKRQILRINHYWTKSLQDLKEKCSRGYPDGCANPRFEESLSRVDYPMKKDYVIQTILNSGR